MTDHPTDSVSMINDRGAFLRWVRATWLGWVLGIPLIVVMALLGEAVGIGGAQALVGAGMGTGIGLLQARAIRRVLPRAAPWFWSCVIGLALPFLLTDVLRVARREFAFSAQIALAAGGIFAGMWQAFLLRARFRRVGWWTLASALGLTLASAMTASADWLRRSQLLSGIWGALAYLGLIASGGLLLGLVTGAALIRLPHREP